MKVNPTLWGMTVESGVGNPLSNCVDSKTSVKHGGGEHHDLRLHESEGHKKADQNQRENE
jgi:hypothetical protein